MLNGNPHDFCSPNPGHHLILKILRTCSLLLPLLPCPGQVANATVSQALPQTPQGSEVSALMGVLETQLRLKQGAAAQQSALRLASLLSFRDPRFF